MSEVRLLGFPTSLDSSVELNARVQTAAYEEKTQKCALQAFWCLYESCQFLYLTRTKPVFTGFACAVQNAMKTDADVVLVTLGNNTTYFPL